MGTASINNPKLMGCSFNPAGPSSSSSCHLFGFREMLDESEEDAGKLALTTSDDGAGEPFTNESDGQLLLEIIRNEEDRDLRHLVSC